MPTGPKRIQGDWAPGVEIQRGPFVGAPEEGHMDRLKHMASGAGYWNHMLDPSLHAAPSEAPGFKHLRYEGHQLDMRGVPSSRVQAMVDPEKHLEHVVKYDLSTDSRNPFTGDKQSTADTMADKEWEARQPAGSVYPRGHHLGAEGQPVHGAGMHEAIVGRDEAVRDPIHQIYDPKRFPAAGGRTMQHQGNHRLVMAALGQKQARESGDPNWSRPVPSNTFGSVQQSIDAEGVRASKQRVATGMAAALAYKAGKVKDALTLGSGRIGSGVETPLEQPSPAPAPEKKRRRFLRRG
jgi:hypothetical protein